MPKRAAPLLLLFLLADIAYSFWQHSRAALDGDLAAIVLPAEWYQTVLHDPLGLQVLLHHNVYAAPNRFFAHAFLSGYFHQVPLWLQHFTEPISSVYLACALLKTTAQLLLLYMLVAYTTGSLMVFTRRGLLAAVLMTPLFQTSGSTDQMAVVDKAVTYAAFYSLPLGLLLLFFFPFYRAWHFRRQLRLTLGWHVLLPVLIVVLALNGPLVAGVVLVVCPLALLLSAWSRYRAGAGQPVFQRARAAWQGIPVPMRVYFGLFCAACLYSIFIGLNNAENGTLPLLARYSLLPRGVLYVLTLRVGLPLLLVLNLGSAALLRRQPPSPERDQLLRVWRWLGLFVLIYLLLLPLGGYRPYRPFILRRDTIMPITLGLMYFFGASGLFLLTRAQLPRRRAYAWGLAVACLFFTLADKPFGRSDNACERAALAQLAAASEDVVTLAANCTVMSWEIMTDPAESDANARMIYHWRITDRVRHYRQAPW